MSTKLSRTKEMTEADWKLYRKKIGVWQETYMNRLNEEYIQLLSQDSSPSDKFWALEKRINQDKKSPGVIVDMKKSFVIMNIVSMINDGVITLEDLNEFSEMFRDKVKINLSFSRNL